MANAKRLLKLADLLEADAANPTGVKFDLAYWARDLGNEVGIAVNCNTAACAVGLACLSGVFTEDGLSWRSSCFSDLIPQFGYAEGFSAVEAFFDLSPRQADNLFLDEKYLAAERKGAVGERAVAKRIREFVAGAQS